MKQSDLDRLTPAMRHYVDTKNENPEAFLFYRLGDFYELFFQDAIVVSSLLDLTLTKKSGGLDEKIPMCGVPYKVADQYIKRLVKRGYTVSICDQVEDPKEAKGLVKREVTRIVSPGTFVGEGDVGARHLSVICKKGAFLQMIHCDYASGECVSESGVVWDSRDVDSFLEKQIAVYRPVEILTDDAMDHNRSLADMAKRYDVDLLRPWHVKNPQIAEDYPQLLKSCSQSDGALILLLDFLERTQLHRQDHLYCRKETKKRSIMDLSETTIRNLELVENSFNATKEYSLYDVLDFTATKMGSRSLKDQILHPIMDTQALEERYDRITALHENRILFDDIVRSLKTIYDIDRLSLSISKGSITPKQIIHLADSLRGAKAIKAAITDSGIESLIQSFSPEDELLARGEAWKAVFTDDPPVAYREQRYIREGFDAELDRLYGLSEGGKNWILELESLEREKTDIKNLRIKYNKILGYFFEVSKSNIERVPDYFVRKQTLVGSERFFTEALKEKEEEILHAKESALDRQYEILERIREEITSRLQDIQSLSASLAALDAVCSLASAADRYDYIRPILNRNGVIDIEGGRHPVVEVHAEEEYIPNDTLLDGERFRLQIITGPNMAGKSTYMRQVALIQILAQIGSYVPADAANLPIVDQIFTRIGASDNLTRGQSTFMVEMTEVAEILRLATARSLILFDEVGRGTSTYDGLSIAWSIAEYIANVVRAKTLFATHYFELTELAERHDGIVNVTVATEERDGEIHFLRKIVRGESNYSFGIDVAKLAGVKEEVIKRARIVLEHLEAREGAGKIENLADSKVEAPAPSPLEEKLCALDINETSPIEALLLLRELQEEARRA
ncbi:DNA mismatch repair protein mutS [Aedoeadaptatus ivorii]|uniref:DNA mismatch repair protein MutS n=1 Tax=Aedoeadaptatus ivorii TaxID=54006 RepID=A0A448V1U5_9FIRM|nr:DNA mismatch repair protein MutS [Peptoniphilus ivorii]VEJ35664.1 DNA mismatch repair protein mutS [Peptoniphilus ivorii]